MTYLVSTILAYGQKQSSYAYRVMITHFGTFSSL